MLISSLSSPGYIIALTDVTFARTGSDSKSKKEIYTGIKN